MRRSYLCLLSTLTAISANAATLNGTYIFGTLQSAGQNLQLQSGARNCGGGGGSTIVRGDGGLKMRIAFGSLNTTASSSDGSLSVAVFNGYAMLLLTGEIGTGVAPNNGTLTFGTRGTGFVNNPQSPTTFGSTFKVTNYKIRDVDKTTVFSFDINLNTFGACKVSFTGTIPTD